jgi:mannose-6-phosphate isomerase
MYVLYPFVMEPYYTDNIWGGRNLVRLGKRLPEGKVAESWEVSARADGESRIANGRWSGEGLKKIMDLFPLDILGEAVFTGENPEFPLLFKLIDANEALSVQVHPDDAYAQSAEGEPYGKHEAWYILEAAPEAGIIYGLSPGIDKERLKRMIEESRIEECLNTVRVRAGDVIDIPPGTVHAIGKGIVLAEIQQNSNLTYRLYDYNRKDAQGRPRELHIEKALDVIDFRPSVPAVKGTAPQGPEDTAVTNLLCNRYFSLDLLSIRGTLEMDAAGDRFCILFVVRGEARILYDEGALSAKMGESILIPAALGRYAVSGECSVLKMHPC